MANPILSLGFSCTLKKPTTTNTTSKNKKSYFCHHHLYYIKLDLSAMNVVTLGNFQALSLQMCIHTLYTLFLLPHSFYIHRNFLLTKFRFQLNLCKYLGFVCQRVEETIEFGSLDSVQFFPKLKNGRFFPSFRKWLSFIWGNLFWVRKDLCCWKRVSQKFLTSLWSGGGRVDPSALTLIYVLTASRHSDSRWVSKLDVTLQRQLQKSFIDLSQERSSRSSCAPLRRSCSALICTVPLLTTKLWL